MRNKYVPVTLVFSVAIFLSACKRNSVTLDYTNAKGEVPQLGNLVFRFNKSLMEDSLLNFWDSTEYVAFEPKIPGRFRWQSPDELIFSPSKPLLPATAYKAKIKNEILKYTDYNNVSAQEDISFHTARLLLTDAQMSWVLQDESSRLALPQFNLHFNYAVKPEDLKNRLKIEVEGKSSYSTVYFTLGSKEMSDEIFSPVSCWLVLICTVPSVPSCSDSTLLILRT